RRRTGHVPRPSPSARAGRPARRGPEPVLRRGPLPPRRLRRRGVLAPRRPPARRSTAPLRHPLPPRGRRLAPNAGGGRGGERRGSRARPAPGASRGGVAASVGERRDRGLRRLRYRRRRRRADGLRMSALLAPDAALPKRDWLLDTKAVARWLAGTLGADGPLPVGPC